MDNLQTDRRYALTIGDYANGDGILITDLQITFSVDKSADNSRTSNGGVVEVYNLSRGTLKRLESEFLSCTLKAGYKDTGIQTILTGNVVRTTTTKQGPDQVTQFQIGEAYVALNHQRLKSLVAPGKTLEDVIEEIRKQMPGVARGAYVGANLNNKVLYGYPLNGSPKRMLQQFAKDNNLEFRIDNNALYVSEINGLISKDSLEAVKISSETGLIDIPYYASGDTASLATDPRRRTGVMFKALLNPAVQPGKLVQLESKVADNLNGFYRINDMRLYGDYRGADWYMDCTCSEVLNVELTT